MNPNQIIIWTVCLSCISLLAQMLRQRHLSGWGAIAGAILAITLGLAYFAPALASSVGGSLWLTLLAIPLWGLNKLNNLVSQQRYRKARTLAQWVRWLHPMDGLLEYPRLLEALEMGQRGQFDRATKILNHDCNLQTPLGRIAMVLLYRMAGQWQDMLLWILENYPSTSLQTDPEITFFYLRALGETGDLNGLVQGFTNLEDIISRTGDLQRLATARMMVLAFCGNPAQVKLIFERQLVNYSPSFQHFWMAIAENAAGNQSLAKQVFEDLTYSQDAALSNAVNWRLSQPHVDPVSTLSESSKQIVDQIGREVHQETMYGKPSRQFSQKAYGTFLLIGLNLVCFAFEILAGSNGSKNIIDVLTGGSENLKVLYSLGALEPTITWHGQWWRLLSATFLHFGWLHLGLNMLGLYFLGIFVEMRLGFWRYLATYLFCGVSSMFVVTIIAIAQNTTNQITVGASGAIMGMVGVTTAILYKAWRKEKSRFAAQRLRTIILIVCLQIFFDLTTPNVSAIGHSSGLTLGFLIGLLLA